MKAIEHATIWSTYIPDQEWAIYQRAIAGARERGLRFALGGAFALATYTGHWRNTKDLDFYILPRDRDAMVDLLTYLGLSDYYDQQPYDRGWIYRAHQGDVIIDAIWSMANYRVEVDEAWLSGDPEMIIRGEYLRILPPEELLWSKLYVLQRDRCDWTDTLNLIYSVGPALDWRHLLNRLAEDAPLLSGVLSIFTWLCPGRAQLLPLWLWEQLHLPGPSTERAVDIDRSRVNLLDSRPWFFPLIAQGEGVKT